MGLLDNISEHQKLIQNIKQDITDVYFVNDLPWVIGYSGGKDSTCTTQIILETLIELKKEGRELNKHIYIISSDTLVETPMIVGTIHSTINAINELASEYNLPVSAHIIRPNYNNSFWANLIGRGYPCPNQTFRWCTDRMKINPANDFIMNIVDKYGEAIMILGVRDGESNSRDRVLQNHTIDGRKLMRHTTMANAYVFAPIRSLNIDDVWEYLLNNDSPWGGNNKELFELYKESDEDCPLIVDSEDKKKTTCGNSRFGCWVCTVVSKDKSLTSFINKGETWLLPLLEYRNWLYSIRDNESMRMRRRQDGSVYFSKIGKNSDTSLFIAAKGDRKKITINLNDDGQWIDNDGAQWHVFDGVNCEDEAKKYIFENNINLSDGSNPHIIIKRINEEYAQLGPGPFTQAAREEMLRRLLVLQTIIGDRYTLIQTDELLEIRKLWYKYGIWEDSVSQIYYDVFKKELNLIADDIRLFNDDDITMLSKICNDENVNFGLMLDLFGLEKKFMGYNNRSELNKQLRKLLSKEYLHLESAGELDEN